MFGLGRKFVLGFLGSCLIGGIGYVASQVPAAAPFVPWVVGSIAALCGLSAGSIAHEDSKRAEAKASVEVAKIMASVPPESGSAPENATTVNVGAPPVASVPGAGA